MAAVLEGAPPLAAPSTPSPSLAELRTRFRVGKTELLDHFEASRPTAPAAGRLLRALSKHVDQTLVALWEHAAMPPGTALLAVGGYGRGELFPHSDVDVLLLLPPAMAVASPELKACIEGFITACWDIGLEIGSSVRTVGECVAMAKADVTIQTALLESRYLCGSRRVFTTFRTANTQAMDAKAFFRAKKLEMEQRHRKFEDTPYSLEPNCKESPGGLRDLQVVIWVARAAGLGKTWSSLASKGLITPFEVKQLNRNEGLLKLIRARLHMIAGRREDRLVFDLQTTVAESFGYAATRGQRAPVLAEPGRPRDPDHDLQVAQAARAFLAVRFERVGRVFVLAVALHHLERLRAQERLRVHRLRVRVAEGVEHAPRAA